MQQHKKIWKVSRKNRTVQEILSCHLGISRITAQLLVNRGIVSIEQAEQFLNSSLEDLMDPYMMKGMRQAVNRIFLAIQANEPITVYGDYDVDGITSTVLLTDVLERLGANCQYYIPNRLTEGYGLNSEVIQGLADDGCKLIVTVDCGISSFEEVCFAGQKGIEVIITDHHEPPEVLPEALAIINPKQEDCPYSFKDLAGVGVAFKLAHALMKERGKAEEVFGFLDVVALGTIADLVPLQGENRILVKKGLPLISDGGRAGLRALLEIAGLKGQEVDSTNVAFALAPRLNAAGRISDAKEGVQLLKEEDFEVALDIAKALDRANRERQAIEAVIYAEAVEAIESANTMHDKVLVVAGSDWHLGVIGIVASKLVNRYYRPVVLLSVDGERAKGSARSIPGFHLFRALQLNKELLIKYGGHSQAAGLTLEVGRVQDLRRALNEYAEDILTEELLIEQINVDSELDFSEVSKELYYQIMQLAPFGCANPSPLLASRSAGVVEYRPVGSDGKHLKLRVAKENYLMEAIGFNLADCCEYVDLGQKVDLVFELQKNQWKGRTTLQLNVKDIKQSGVCDNPFAVQSSTLESAEKGKTFVDGLFEKAAEYLIDDYYRDIVDKDEFYTKVVGVTFENRQEVVRRLKEGDTLYLVREYDNPYDPNAVRVENKYGQQVGYLNARLARHFAPLLEQREQYRVLVSSVTGGDERNFGVNIVIQRLQEKDSEEGKAILREIRERLRALEDADLNEEIRKALLGSHKYRDSQREALESLEGGKNTLAIFGTGRGKSAVFQSFAAKRAIRQGELTVILYPLRALANDQYEVMQAKLSRLGLRVFRGNGSLSAGERGDLFAAIASGELDILLTTPEFLAFHIDKLLKMPKKTGFFVVDESHHISLASLSQRPAYKKLSAIVNLLGEPLTLAVTATARDEVAQEIVDVLQIEEMVIDTHVRANMELIDKRGVRDKDAYLREIVAREGKTVIYVNSRTKAVEIALMLREANPHRSEEIAYYHAGLKNEDRKTIESMFKEGALTVVVATSAFGEGIDIPDIRHVVLYHLNFNFTEFNQQSGRGGRDGKRTYIHLLSGSRDIRINEFILEASAPERNLLAVLYTVLAQLQKGSEGVRLTNKEIAERMHRAGVRRVKDSSVSAGLGILEELGLIRRESAGRDRQIIVNPQPAKKVSLEKSLRFMEGLEERAAFDEFQHSFFSASPEELLSRINQPIYPTSAIKFAKTS